MLVAQPNLFKLSLGRTEKEDKEWYIDETINMDTFYEVYQAIKVRSFQRKSVYRINILSKEKGKRVLEKNSKIYIPSNGKLCLTHKLTFSKC